MSQDSQAFKATEIITDERVSALSWNIATEPKLYRELADNPYSPRTVQIISERFPDVSTADIIRAVVLAEPEERYDRNFKLLDTQQQEEELRKQKYVSIKINERLVQYCNEYTREFSQLPKKFVYNCLFVVVLRTADLKEVEEKYSQNQRRDFKLSIVNFIENLPRLTSNPVQKDDDSSSAAKVYYEKPAPWRPLLMSAFAMLSFVLLFSLASGLYAQQIEQRQTQSTNQHPADKKQVLGLETQKESQGFPVHLMIPEINVNAYIEHLGVTLKGEMEVPINIADVGWYKLGSSPGEKGSAVIAGHFNGKNGETGVFANLSKLKKGDKLYIEDEKGAITTFVVRESRMYDPGYAEDVFSLNDSAHLNLITCDGVWDGTKKSYTKRLVVFSDIL